LPVTHNLYIRLEKALREHNIEIPVPQRDVHIRSVNQEFGVTAHDIQKTCEANGLT